MIYSAEVKGMCPVHQGVHHGAAPIPEEGKWVKPQQISDISGYTHGVGWCAPQQGACKLLAGVHLSREPASFHSTLRTVSFRKLWLRLLAAPE